jgi:hypothetical protein
MFFAGAMIVAGGSTSAALAAEVAGKVADAGGAPIAGIEISARNAANAQVARVISDSSGRYTIHDITPGTYIFSASGQTAVAYVAADGLTVDWGIAPSAPAIAIARRGVGDLAGASSAVK